MPHVRLTKEQQRRRQRWYRECVPRVRASTRPNSCYIDSPRVHAVLQHLSDGLNELLMTRPLKPFVWLTDYLRRVCKVGLSIEQDPQIVLILEMHKKRRVIQHAILDTQADERECKVLIRRIIAQEAELDLPPDELRLDTADHAFLATEIPSHQSQWSVDVSALPLAPSTHAVVESLPGDETQDEAEAEAKPSEPTDEATATVDAWIRRHLLPLRHLDEYYDVVLRGVVRAMVELVLAAPESPAEWLVRHFRAIDRPPSPAAAAAASASAPSTDPSLGLLFRTNYELLRKIESLKAAQRAMHLRRERLEDMHQRLTEELAMRARFIDKLRTSRVTTRTHAVMEGTPVFLNGQKHWVLPGWLLVPTALGGDELLGLARAERFLMEADERRWRFLLRAQLEYDASTRIQSTWRGAVAARAYRVTMARRHAAASVLQRNYFQYLYDRATRLPPWCVVGHEVLIAPSVAQKCAITFQFYRHKDFPPGNYKRLPGRSVAELQDLCRQDEECAGFTTDGALKRFVPRKLSQLRPMAPPPPAGGGGSRGLTPHDGLFIKVYPPKHERVVNTGIITAVPGDRFGLVTVVLDGTGVQEAIPLPKLSDRWRRIRVRRHQRVEKKQARLVFGGGRTSGNNTPVEIDEPPTSPPVGGVGAGVGYDVLEDEDERVVRRRRVRVQSNEREAADPLVDFIYEDQATGIRREREPRSTFGDPDECARVIARRRAEYLEAQGRADEAKRLASAIRLQCAWRSKRAREAFRQVLLLRAKEKERERLVEGIHASHHQQQQQQPKKRRKPTQHARKGFLSRWLGKTP